MGRIARNREFGEAPLTGAASKERSAIDPPHASDLDPAERASRDELIATQAKRLASTLRHVYAHVPHYRQAFEQAGVHPSDFRGLSELSWFPVTAEHDF